MKTILSFLLSVFSFSTLLFGESERPETIVIPVSSLGEVSEVRKQILQNTLEDELKSHFRLISQERYEEILEKVFGELDYKECNEDQCIVMIQEMLQVENVFHLQVLGEGDDTQLSLSWKTLDEKRKEEEFCEGCRTGELRKMIGGLVDEMIGGKERVVEKPVVVVETPKVVPK